MKQSHDTKKGVHFLSENPQNFLQMRSKGVLLIVTLKTRRPPEAEGRVGLALTIYRDLLCLSKRKQEILWL